MPWPPIIKSRRDWETVPNLHDYSVVRAHFSWDGARKDLDGLPNGQGLNIAHEAVDRHAEGPKSHHLAIRWLGKDRTVKDYTYHRLQELTNRFANVLVGLGVGKGDRVFVLAGRIPELYISALGTLKNRSVFCSSAMSQAVPQWQIRLIITNLLDQTDPHYRIEHTDPEDMALLHFTSGTTGTPKGAIHVHEAVVAHHATGKLALDFHKDGPLGTDRRPDERCVHGTSVRCE